jgi:hypothetical protein
MDHADERETQSGQDGCCSNNNELGDHDVFGHAPADGCDPLVRSNPHDARGDDMGC